MSTEAPPPVSAPTPATEDRTVAILTYLTIIGFIVAIVIHSSSTKKTALGAFHLRQGLGLLVTALVLGVCGVLLMFIPILGWLAICAAWLCFFIMWLMGLIAAATGQSKPAPILGEQYQKWFAGAFG